MARLVAAAPLLMLVALAEAKGCAGGSSGAARASASPTPVSVAVIPPTPVPVPPTVAPDLFASSVRPIVLAHCAPCHEPGGRMYARLPFDDPKVLSSHSAGVLRRLKGDDKAAFERWLATLQ